MDATVSGTRELALKPPRAAAVAGIIFSVLMIASLVIVRLATTSYPDELGWITDPTHRIAVRLALNLVPFSGVAFLWFIGVLRNRLGKFEDQFFGTVFLGSGLLFVASVFGSVTSADALLASASARNSPYLQNEIYLFARRVTYTFLNVFGIKMAAVFMFSTCTIGLRTTLFPRWVAYLGIACGVVLLVVISDWPWIALLFPLWTLVVSSEILLVA